VIKVLNSQVIFISGSLKLIIGFALLLRLKQQVKHIDFLIPDKIPPFLGIYFKLQVLRLVTILHVILADLAHYFSSNITHSNDSPLAL